MNKKDQHERDNRLEYIVMKLTQIMAHSHIKLEAWHKELTKLLNDALKVEKGELTFFSHDQLKMWGGKIKW